MMKFITKADKNMRLMSMLFLVLMSSALIGQDNCPEPTDNLSKVVFTLDQCTSFFDDGSHTDYSEFEPENRNNSDCADMLVIGKSLYRLNPTENHHSCTPGFDGQEGMCVSSSMSCMFEDNSEQAIRFDIELTPGQGSAQLKEIKFYEKGPAEYVWIDGASGANNYPASYGVRITANGQEVYKRIDIPTGREWSLQTIDLSQLEGFTVDAPTIFSVELLAYCPEDNGAEVSIWDVDQIEVYAGCVTEINGGMLTTNDGTSTVDICIGDAVSINLTPKLEFATGATQTWVLTDASENIIGLPTGPSFDLQEFGEGPCKLYNVSYDGTIDGLSIGNNLSQLDGCYDLSNAIDINKKLVDGGSIDFDITSGDCGATDEIVFSLSTNDLPAGVSGDDNRWEIRQGAQVTMGEGNPYSFTLTNASDLVEITLSNNTSNGCNLVSQKSFDPAEFMGDDPRFRFDVTSCNETQVDATFTSEFDDMGGVPVTSYDWVFFMNNNSFEMSGKTVTVQIPTRYDLMVRLKLTLENGCSFTVTEAVDFGDVPTVKTFSNPIYVCNNEPTSVVSNPNSDWLYNWVPETGLTFDDSSKSNPTFNGSRSQKYKVTVISPLCAIEDEIEIIVLEDIIIDVVGDIVNCSPRGMLSVNNPVNITYEWATDENFSNSLGEGTSINYDFTGQTDGNIYVRATAPNGCTSKTQKVDIKITEGIDLEFIDGGDGIVEVCQGVGGMIILNPNPNWTYEWSPMTGISGDLYNPKVNPSEPTTYTVTVTSGECTMTREIEVIPGENFEIEINGLDADGNITTCAGSTTLTVAGMCEPNYVWSTDESFTTILSRGQTLNVTESGTYYVRGLQQGCVSEVDEVTVTLGDGPSIEFTDDGDGVIQVCEGVGGMIVKNPNPAWTYIWSPTTGLSGDLSSPKVNPTETTTYQVTVTDGACEAYGAVQVVPGDQLDISVVGTDENGEINTCAGGQTLRVVGNCDPNYEWSTDNSFANVLSTGPSLTVTESGSYYVRAILNGNCQSEVEEIDVILGDGPFIEFTDGGDGIVDVCSGAGGRIVLNPNPAWTYTWSPMTGITGDLSNPKVNPSESTLYNVTVTDGSCEAYGEVLVSPGDIQEIEILGKTSDGQIDVCSSSTTLMVAGNCEPNYEWSRSSDFSDVISNQDFLNVTEGGDYYVRAIVEGSCTSEVEQITVTLGDGPGVDFTGGDDGIAEVCGTAGGMIVMNPNPAWTYTWSPDQISGDPSNPKFQISETTKYTVTVTDGSCEAVGMIIVTPGDRLEIEILDELADGTIEACGGEHQLVVRGNCEPNYEWSDNADFSNILGTSDMLTVTSSGKYYVRAVLGDVCETEVEEVDVTLGDEELNIEFMAGDDNVVELCEGVGAMIVMNPNPNFTYTWTPMDGISGDLSNPLVNPDGTTTYTVTVSNGTCEVSKQIEVRPSSTTEVDVVGLDVDGRVNLCSADQEIMVMGNAEGTYEWSTDAGFSNIIGTSDKVTVTEEGTYYVRAVISTGCESEVLEFEVVFGESDLELEFMGGDDGIVDLCENIGGMIITNPNPDWTYTWSPMDGISGDLFNPTVAPETTTVYTVTVSDGTCEISKQIEVNPTNTTEIEVLDLDMDDRIVDCNSEVDVTVMGNAEGTYEWSADPDFGSLLGTESTITITESGIYFVRATMSTDCESEVVQFEVALGEDSDEVSIDFTDDDGDGEVMVCENIGGMIVSNPNPEWTYTWTPMDGISGDLSNPKVNPTETTTYDVTVSNGTCEVTESITVVPGNMMEISASGVGADGTLDVCGGSKTVTMSGNCEPNYEWSRTEDFAEIISTQDFYNISEVGKYFVRAVTGDENCISEVVEIDAILGDGPSLEFTDGGDGIVEVCEGVGAMIIANPNPEWTYTWSPTEGLEGDDLSNPKVNPTEPTTYSVTVSDGVCETDGMVLVVPGDSLEISVEGADSEGRVLVCNGETVTLTVRGNCEDNYEWSINEAFDPVISTSDVLTTQVTLGEEYYVRAIIEGCNSEVEKITISDISGEFKLPEGTEICPGDTLTFALEAVNNPDSIAITWNADDHIISDLDGEEITIVSFEGDGDITLSFTKMTADGNCTATDSITVPMGSDMNNLDVNVDIDCSTFMVCFETDRMDGDLSWDFGDETTADDVSTEGSPCYMYPGPGEYLAVVQGASTCGAGEMSIPILLGELSITTMSDTISFCEGDEVAISANSDQPQNIYWSSMNGDTLGTGPSVMVSPVSDTTVFAIVTDGATCRDSVSIFLDGYFFDVEVMQPDPICPGEELSVSAINSGTDSLTYVWGPEECIVAGGDTPTPQVTAELSKDIFLTVTNPENGCSKEFTIPITISDLDLELSADPDSTINRGESVDITAGSSGDNLEWAWSNGETTETIIVQPEETTVYNVQVTDENGCEADGTITITVIQPVCDSSDVFIPSGFSPNGDGINDELIVRSNFIKEMELDIYNRWGEVVFNTTDQRTGWNGMFDNAGEEMHSDTYAYCLKVTCTNDLSYTMLGNVTLVR